MTIAQRVAAFVRDIAPKTICDDCLQRRLGLTKPQQAQHVTRALQLTPFFEGGDGRCAVCFGVKHTIRYAPKQSAVTGRSA